MPGAALLKLKLQPMTVTVAVTVTALQGSESPEPAGRQAAAVPLVYPGTARAAAGLSTGGTLAAAAGTQGRVGDTAAAVGTYWLCWASSSHSAA